MAEQQAENVVKSVDVSDGLDMTVERIDMFKFQDQDFTSVRKNLQDVIRAR